MEVFKPSAGTPYYLSTFVIPNEVSEISSEEEVRVTCTLPPHENKTALVYLLVNWSPDSIIRYRWIPIEEDYTFEAYKTKSTSDITSGLTGLTFLVSLVTILLVKKGKRKDI